MINTVKFSVFIILATILISCSGFTFGSEQQVTPTLSSTPASPTPKPLATATLAPSITPTVSSITPIQANNPACIVASQTTESDGWDCLNQSYGFSMHFPYTAEFSRITPGGSVEVRLRNSPSNPRIDRLLAIGIEQSAEWCFPPEAEKIQIGENEFTVNNGFEPSGVVFAWKTYAIAKESKRVCFDFVVGFREWAQDDPLFPPEKDQDLEELESILATFRWLEP
ncbi:MAG: hypothetical protein HZB50_17730 [Chloroflexi bacterium]|nr:hypothetical protein [Chloroflexota bacterium]